MAFVDLSCDRKRHLGFRLSRYGVKELQAPDFPRDYPLRFAVGASPLLASKSAVITHCKGKFVVLLVLTRQGISLP